MKKPHLGSNSMKEGSSAKMEEKKVPDDIKELAKFMKSLIKPPTDPKYLPGSDLLGVSQLVMSEMDSEKEINEKD